MGRILNYIMKVLSKMMKRVRKTLGSVLPGGMPGLAQEAEEISEVIESAVEEDVVKPKNDFVEMNKNIGHLANTILFYAKEPNADKKSAVENTIKSLFPKQHEEMMKLINSLNNDALDTIAKEGKKGCVLLVKHMLGNDIHPLFSNNILDMQKYKRFTPVQTAPKTNVFEAEENIQKVGMR